MSLDNVYGFLNDSVNQGSVLLALGSGLTGPGGANVQVVPTSGPSTWNASTLDYSSMGDWVVIGLVCTAASHLKHHGQRGLLSEQLNITVTITPIDTTGAPTGSPVSNTVVIVGISDPNLILLALRNPLAPPVPGTL
jgi:hypothetical protein